MSTVPVKPRSTREQIATKLEERKIRDLLDKAQYPAPKKS